MYFLIYSAFHTLKACEVPWLAEFFSFLIKCEGVLSNKVSSTLAFIVNSISEFFMLMFFDKGRFSHLKK